MITIDFFPQASQSFSNNDYSLFSSYLSNCLNHLIVNFNSKRSRFLSRLLWWTSGTRPSSVWTTFNLFGRCSGTTRSSSRKLLWQVLTVQHRFPRPFWLFVFKKYFKYTRSRQISSTAYCDEIAQDHFLNITVGYNIKSGFGYNLLMFQTGHIKRLPRSLNSVGNYRWTVLIRLFNYFNQQVT